MTAEVAIPAVLHFPQPRPAVEAFNYTGIPMKFLLLVLLLVLRLDISAAASNSVVNLSHYDIIPPDFQLMRQEGIIGIIHEATYPPFLRDERYSGRQFEAT